jgi:DNA-binding LytR/AlgR family response regulator
MERNPNQLIIRERGGAHTLRMEDILRIESARVYSVVYVKNAARQYISSVHLGKLEKLLEGKQFMRVHKSHVVNLYEIKAMYGKRNMKVKLSDNTVVAVAQRKKTAVVNQLRIINGKNPIHPQKGLRINP